MGQQRKCLIVIGGTPPPHHGVNIYIQSILKSKLQDYFDVVHVDTSDHRDLNNLSNFDVTNVYVALKSIWRLMIALIMHKPSIVYVPISATFLPYLRDGVFIIMSRLFSHARIVVHLHGGRYFRDQFYEASSVPVRLFVSRTLRMVDVAMVLSSRLLYVFEGLVKDVVVLANGSDFTESRRSTQAVSELNKRIYVGYMSNLAEAKGVLDLLQAAAEIVKSHKEVVFRFAGSWWDDGRNTKKRSEEFIANSDIAGHVEFVGFVSGKTKEEFLTNTDIFVLPSWNEGFPLAILEAMSAGCPVVATKDVGAIPDIVVDGITGILVEKQNPRILAQAISRLLEDTQLQRSMGNAGRERFLANYTMDRHINNLIAVLNKCTG